MDSITRSPEIAPAGARPLVSADFTVTGTRRPEPLFAAGWTWHGAAELVAGGEAALARLVGDPDCFRAHHAGLRPLVRSTGGFTDLIDLDDVARLLASWPLADPRMALLGGQEPQGLESSQHDHRGTREGPGVVEVAGITSALAAGATLVISDAQDLRPRLNDPCDLLAVALGRTATADVRLSMGGGPDLVAQPAVDDGFVLQVTGTTHWAVEGWVPDPGQPPGRGWTELTGRKELLEVDLAAGQCLALPAGFTCSSHPVEGPALEVVIWVDGRPSGSAPPGDPAERFWSGGGPGVASSVISALIADAITTATVCRRTPGAVAWMRVEGDQLVLRTGRRELVMPARLRPWVDRLLADPPLRVRDLTSANLMADAVVLVQRLVQEGLVTLV